MKRVMKMLTEKDIFNGLDNINIPVFLTDPSRKCIYCNKYFYQFIKRNKIKEEEILDFAKEHKNMWIYYSSTKGKYLILKNSDLIGNIFHFILDANEMIQNLSILNIFNLLYEDIRNILNCIKVGIYITDQEANTLMLNEESERTGGMTANEVLGHNMKDLVAEGYCTESASLKVIRTKSESSIIQHLGDGDQILTTGTPFFRNGDLSLIICTERDITEVIKLRNLLEEKEKIAEQYESELEYFRKLNILKNDLVVESIEMQKIFKLALKVSKMDTTVLIQGESGAGKEVIADLIYQNSTRSKGSIIKINCGAIPHNLLESELFGYEKGSFTGANVEGKKGLFELADKGTLFLDEIGELPLALQSKLLRVIQEKEIMRIGGTKTIPIDVRIIAATNIDLKDAVDKGKFRQDLYYRLNVVPILIPPLRERKEDIDKLVRYFINKYNLKYKTDKRIDIEAIELLKEYKWPGNVRELENLIERLIVMSDEKIISSKQICNQLYDQDYPTNQNFTDNILSYQEYLERFEKKLLSGLIRKFKNSSELAKALKVNKSTISRKFKKYNI